MISRPSFMFARPAVRDTAFVGFTGGAVLAGLVPLLGGFDPRLLAAFAFYFVWIALAESWNLAGGFAGLLNLGLVAFFGLGAVVGAAGLQFGVPAPAVVVLAGLAGVVLAVTLVPIFRLKTFYFAMATLVIPYMVKPVVEVLGGNSVYHVPVNQILTPLQLYYSGLALLVAAVVGVRLVMRSKVGLALRSLGNDEVASASIGVNVTFYKGVALAVSGLLASVAGLYYVEITGTAETTIFQNLGFSLLPIFMVVIGGTATFAGPIVGALLFSALDYFLSSQLPGSTLDTFILSLAVVGVAVFRPRGLFSRSDSR